ncbi:MAG: transposase [Patescibacteria group bacterium]|nr:transposase [Patescibacteria group bacterium]MDD5716137.1 transposase [Patescibacteria group bacterium]
MTQRRIYQDEYSYFVTFRTREGFRLFEETRYAELLASIIVKTGEMKGYDVLAWQIMPDHVHILVGAAGRWNGIAAAEIKKSTAPVINSTAPTAGCGMNKNKINISRAQPAVVARSGKLFTVSDLVHGIKSYFYDQLRNSYGINFPYFQKRFYIRIVNTDEYFRTVIEYIKRNPFKAKLPGRYSGRPYQYINWALVCLPTEH